MSGAEIYFWRMVSVISGADVSRELSEMAVDGLRGFAGDDGVEGFDAGLFDAAEAAEVLEQAGDGCGRRLRECRAARSRGRAFRGACGGR